MLRRIVAQVSGKTLREDLLNKLTILNDNSGDNLDFY